MITSASAKPVPFSLPASKAAQRRQWLVFFSIILLTLLARLPFIHFIDDDEAFYSLVAQRWLQGAWPYAESFDVKPPLLFAIFTAAQSLFGASLATIKGLEIVFTIWGAVALQKLIERRGAYNVSLWAGGLFPLLSLAQAGTNSANALLLSPFIISAFSAMSEAAGGTHRPSRQIFLAGLWIGLAGMVKQTALFEAVGLVGFALWYFRHRRPVQVLLLFSAGAALPVLSFGLFFAAAGHFRDAFRAVVIGAVTRGGLKISIADDSGLFWIVHFILLISPLAILLMAAMVAVARREVIGRTFPRPLFWLTVIWVVSAAVGCIAGQSALRYYGSNLIAPLLILSGACILSVAPAKAWPRTVAIAGATLATLACVVFVERQGLGLGRQAPGDDYSAARVTAAELERLGYSTSDSLLVPDRGLYVYLETGTVPRGRYFHPMHLTCDFPTPERSPLVSALAARPRFVVMSDPFRHLNCENPRYRALLDATLKADYRLAGVATGRWSRSLIYEIRPVSTNRHPDQHAQ